jgi:hypothetical protein
MGTHNRLLKLGAGRFLEVIAIDPEAPAPGRRRWFDLDAPFMRQRLARGPDLIHWVDLHPADALPESRCALLEFHPAGGRLGAVFSTPSGVRTMGSRE